MRFYSFSEGDSTVTLGTRRFVNETPLLGLCDRPESERAIDFANIVPQSCDLDLNWLLDRYIGTNAPVGCPASFPIARVVSDIVIQENSIDSLDRGFDASGNLIFGTLIEFRRINKIPEPSFAIGFLVLGILGIGSVICKS
jgi:hypothetical protein